MSDWSTLQEELGIRLKNIFLVVCLKFINFKKQVVTKIFQQPSDQFCLERLATSNHFQLHACKVHYTKVCTYAQQQVYY